MKVLVLLGEFTAVLLGVLGALLVEEWRDARLDRETEAVYLEQLVEDLHADRRELVVADERFLAELRLYDALLAWLGADRSGHFDVLPDYASPLAEEVDAGALALRDLGEYGVFRSSNPTYLSILGSGDLKTISDPALRRAVVHYYQEVELRNRDGGEFFRDAVRVRDLVVGAGIDIFAPVDPERLRALPGLAAAVSAARDSSHWRVARLRLVRRAQDALLDEIERTGAASRERLDVIRKLKRGDIDYSAKDYAVAGP